MNSPRNIFTGLLSSMKSPINQEPENGSYFKPIDVDQSADPGPSKIAQPLSVNVINNSIESQLTKLGTNETKEFKDEKLRFECLHNNCVILLTKQDHELAKNMIESGEIVYWPTVSKNRKTLKRNCKTDKMKKTIKRRSRFDILREKLRKSLPKRILPNVEPFNGRSFKRGTFLFEIPQLNGVRPPVLKLLEKGLILRILKAKKPDTVELKNENKDIVKYIWSSKRECFDAEKWWKYTEADLTEPAILGNERCRVIRDVSVHIPTVPQISEAQKLYAMELKRYETEMKEMEKPLADFRTPTKIEEKPSMPENDGILPCGSGKNSTHSEKGINSKRDLNIGYMSDDVDMAAISKDTIINGIDDADSDDDVQILVEKIVTSAANNMDVKWPEYLEAVIRLAMNKQDKNDDNRISRFINSRIPEQISNLTNLANDLKNLIENYRTFQVGRPEYKLTACQITCQICLQNKDQPSRTVYFRDAVPDAKARWRSCVSCLQCSATLYDHYAITHQLLYMTRELVDKCQIHMHQCPKESFDVRSVLKKKSWFEDFAQLLHPTLSKHDIDAALEMFIR